jgi:hypothetical protein
MDAAAAPPSLLSRLLGWMGAEAPKLLVSIVILVLGFWIKDSVDLAIKQRQLDLSYAKEMLGLLQTFTQEQDNQKLRDTAVVLASFGEPALPVLLMALRQDDLHSVAAGQGLEALALRDPELLCRRLPPLLLKPNQHYDMRSHEVLIALVGDNGCSKALPELRRYREWVQAAQAGQATELLRRVRGPVREPATDYPGLLNTVDGAIANLS